jgi:methanogenic corrinoid protein MtbC1
MVRSRSTRSDAAAAEPRIAIGALARATGVPVETLRTWESRYGFPEPQRKPSGHRVYPVSQVARLRRIGEALASGLRAGDVVGAAPEELDRLLEALRGRVSPVEGGAPLAATIEALLAAVAALDRKRVAHALAAEAGRLGPLEFAEGRVAPLLHAVGAAWAEGRLDVRHEHFLSQRVEDLLRSLRTPLEEAATGAVAVTATLEGEQHGLGVQMASLVLAAAGWRPLVLGASAPPSEIAAAAREGRAGVVGVSVSVASSGPVAAAELRRLREALPRRTHLVLGGDGAPSIAGAETFRDLRSFDRWLRSSAVASGMARR